MPEQDLSKTPREGFLRAPDPTDLERVNALMTALQREMALLSTRLPVPEAAPAARRFTAGRVTQYGLIAVGALGVAQQVAALFKPELVGPIQGLLKLVSALGGGQ